MRWIRRKFVRYLLGSADSLELSEIVKMIVHRYAELFEEEEVVFLSLPKHSKEERSRIICAALEMEKL